MYGEEAYHDRRTKALTLHSSPTCFFVSQGLLLPDANNLEVGKIAAAHSGMRMSLFIRFGI